MIRVPIQRKGRKPACTNALHRLRPILTGQQWNKSEHDDKGVGALSGTPAFLFYLPPARMSATTLFPAAASRRWSLITVTRSKPDSIMRLAYPVSLH